MINNRSGELPRYLNTKKVGGNDALVYQIKNKGK